MLTTLHEDLAVDFQRPAAGASNHLQNSKLAYWSTVFVSMVSSGAVSSHLTTSSISAASVITDCQPTASIPLRAVIANH